MAIRRFLNTAIAMEEVPEKMDVSIGDLEKLLKKRKVKLD